MSALDSVIQYFDLYSDVRPGRWAIASDTGTPPTTEISSTTKLLPQALQSLHHPPRRQRYHINHTLVTSCYNHEMDKADRPEKPQHLSEYALLCLEALSRSGLADRLSLGGAVGLMHYYEYRTTHDVDAWWMHTTNQHERQGIVSVLEKTLAPFGEVRTRKWGEVASIELRLEGKAVFSFQIAERSVLLKTPRPSPWPGILLDDLSDLVASKMTALVERGAPRDFLDIYHLCKQGMMTPETCWGLWQMRQETTEGESDLNRASLAVQLHLERIEMHRPLSQIDGLNERESANQLRRWFRREFLNVERD